MNNTSERRYRRTSPAAIACRTCRTDRPLVSGTHRPTKSTHAERMSAKGTKAILEPAAASPRTSSPRKDCIGRKETPTRKLQNQLNAPAVDAASGLVALSKS